jgi:ribonuclease III
MTITDEEREVLEAALVHRFRRPDWLERALTHRSHRQSAESVSGLDNERLEFLGDRVLGLVVSVYLLTAFPDWDAGMLSKGEARLVSASSLLTAAQSIGLGRHLRLGPGEEKTGGREKPNLLADAYEAVVAAIYLDAGLEAAAGFIGRSLLEPAFAGKAGLLNQADHKSALQEWLQQRGICRAEYRVVNESGPDHRKVFVIEVWLENRRLAAAEGLSKKEAEQAAARLALGRLQNDQPD